MSNETTSLQKVRKKKSKPANSPYPELRFCIKGIKWAARLLPEAEYERLHGDDSRAMCVLDSNIIDVNSQYANFSTVAHELGHAYIESCLVHRDHLDQEEFEELFCELIGEHSIHIVSLTRRILKKFSRTVTQEQ